MTGRKKVLLVEDDEATRQLFTHYLEREGCDILLAADGKEALEVARSFLPDLVVLDLMLPEIHGIGVCKALKSGPATQKAKVIIVTVKGFPADRKQAAEAGADDFLAKPVTQKDFLDAVRAALLK